jgi:cell division protein FtsB
VDLALNFGGKLAWPLLVGGMLVLCVLGLVRGLSHLNQVQDELQQVRATNLRLDKDNNAMYRQVLRLRSDPQALERACRRDMGVVRQDEVVYQQEQPLPRPAGKDQP